jgi:hypothetical protein
MPSDPLARDHYLSVADVAAKLAISEEAVLAHIHARRLIAANVGQGVYRPRWRIRPEDLEYFLVSRTSTAKPAKVQRMRSKQRLIEFF